MSGVTRNLASAGRVAPGDFLNRAHAHNLDGGYVGRHAVLTARVVAKLTSVPVAAIIVPSLTHGLIFG
jgi:hypothetical protein